MLDHLVAHPENGLLAYEIGLPTVVQYWRSFEQLEAFAKDKDDPHLDVWRNYAAPGRANDRTGISTRRFSSGRATTRRSTATCPAWARQGRAARPGARISSARARLKGSNA